MKRVNMHELPHRELQSARTGERFSLSAVLSDPLGMRDVFVHHEVIPAGRRASGAHFHTHREELVVVLRGEVVAWCGGEEVRLVEGDVVAFAPGEAHAHCVRNDSAQPAEVLVIASNPAQDDTVYVPASHVSV
jgi:uncharacterized cupin superfamily protein